MEAVGVTLPDDYDFAAELLCDRTKAGFVRHERAILFGAARDVDG